MQQQNSGLSNWLQKQKKTFYQLTNQLVNVQLDLRLFYLLTTIQLLQIISSQAHSVFKFSALGMQQFRQFSHFINPQYFLKTTLLMNYIIPIGLGVIVIHVGVFGIAYRQFRKRDQMSDIKDVKKAKLIVITHYFNVILVKVLTIPLFMPSLLVFYCKNNNPYHHGRTCYNTFHLILICMGFLNIAWILIINVYYFMIYFTKNPFIKDNYLVIASPLWKLVKFIVKIAPACYLIYDANIVFNYLYMFGIAGGVLGIPYLAQSFTYKNYNRQCQKRLIYIQVIACSISICLVIQLLFFIPSGIDISFIFSFIVAIPYGYLSHVKVLQKKKKLLLIINKYEKENIPSFQELIVDFIVKLEDKNINKKKKSMFKIIKMHYDKCQNVMCSCHVYIQNFQKNDNYYQDTNHIYRVFLQILNKAIQTDKKAYSLSILISYIQFFKLNNCITSAFIISKVMNEKISLFQDYLITGFLYELSKSFEDNSDIQKFRLFSVHLIKFQDLTVDMARQYQQFWNQLMEQNSSIQKIMKLLKKIKKYKQEINSKFQTLQGIFPTSTRIFSIYCQLSKQILLDIDLFTKSKQNYLQNCRQTIPSKLMRPQHLIKFLPNQDILVFNVAVNQTNDIFHGGCTVISVTSNVYQILGYTSIDLIDKNINRFLPKIYIDFHDNIINKYLNKQQGDIITREIVVFPINAKGYPVQCVFTNKIMPSLQHGILLSSFFLKTSNSQNYIIYDKRTGLIDSMSQNAETYLLGKKTKTKSISLPDHIGDVFPFWDYIKEQVNEQVRDSATTLSSDFCNIMLYRSDGLQDQRYVKIISFNFNTNKLFNHYLNQEDVVYQDNRWNMQTLLENTSNKQLYIKQTEQSPSFTGIISGSPKSMLTQRMKQNTKTVHIKQTLLVSPISKRYENVYIYTQLIFLVTLVGLIIYNYIETLNFYQDYMNNIEIKEKIEQAQILTIQSSVLASQILYHNGLQSLNVSQSLIKGEQQIMSLMSLSQSLYPSIISKQNSGVLLAGQVNLVVTYYSSPGVYTLKNQSLTDSTYQYVMYLLEIFKSQYPLTLNNNILFVFNNNNLIEEKLGQLNQFFTQYVSKCAQNRINHLYLLFFVMSLLILLSLVWQVTYRCVVINKINEVLSIYESISIEHLQKYPKKCQKFISFIKPLRKSNNALKSMTQIVTIINDDNMQMLYDEDGNLIEDEDQESIQYITFTKNHSNINILIQSLAFILIFATIFFGWVYNQNSVYNNNSLSLSKWKDISKLRSEVQKQIYFVNEYKNFNSQWNISEVNQKEQKFTKSRKILQQLLQTSQNIDQLMQTFYRLFQQLISIMQDTTSTPQQTFISQQKLQTFSSSLQTFQLDPIINTSFETTISTFLNTIQLILIVQLIAFICYSAVYVPKVFKHYRQKVELAIFMYETLGFRLREKAREQLKSSKKV